MDLEALVVRLGQQDSPAHASVRSEIDDARIDLHRPLATFDLSTRAQRVLLNLGIVDFAGLVAISAAQLRAVPNCGRVTVQELRRLAAARGLRLRDDEDAAVPPREALDAPLDEALSLRLDSVPMSLRARRVLANAKAITLRDLVRRPADVWRMIDGCGPGTLAELTSIARREGFGLGSTTPRHRPTRTAKATPVDPSQRVDSSAGLAREIETAVRACFPAAVERVCARIGLDVEDAPTLLDVGNRYGCTRERVRQVVQRCGLRAQRLALPMPVLRTVVARLEGAPSGSMEASRAALVDGGLIDAGVTVAGVIRAAELFGVEHGLSSVRTAVGRIVGRPDELVAFDAIRATLRRTVEHHGCTSIAQVLRAVGDRPAVTLDLVRRMVDVDAGVRWLDRDAGWFWRPGAKRNRLVARLQKILTVAEGLDVVSLRAALLRDPRLEHQVPPGPVLAELCRALDGMQVERGGSRVRAIRRRPEFLSPVERAVVDVLRRHGPVVPTPLATSLVVRAGVNENTVSVIFANSPLVRRVGQDAIALVGTVRGAEAPRGTHRATQGRVVGHMTVGELARIARMSVHDVVALAMGDVARPSRR